MALSTEVQFVRVIVGPGVATPLNFSTPPQDQVTSNF